MGKKIIPIIVDTDNTLSNDLIIINIAHVYCNIDNLETYTILKEGIYKYVDKYFITSSENIAIQLVYDFPHSSIYFIGKPILKLPINVEIFININDPVFKYIANDYVYYSMKEIRYLNEKNKCIDDFSLYNLNIILTGEINYTMSLTNIKNIIISIKNNRFIKNKYLIENIRIFYCAIKNDFITKYLNIDRHIEIIFPTNEEKQLDISVMADRMKLYNLIDRSVYFNHWYALNKMVDLIYENKFDGMRQFQCDNTITLTIDISRLDKNVKYIDLTDEIFGIASKREESNFMHEVLYLYSDVVAIGSFKAMNYYMTLYSLYGTYNFKNMQIDYTNNGIFDTDHYSKLSAKYRLRSDAQLFGHIHSLTNLAITHVFPISEASNIKLKSQHLILVTYYGIYDQFIFIKQSLENIGYIVHDYPYMAYSNDGGNLRLLEEMKKIFIQYNPIYVLWWSLNINANTLYNITMLDKRIKHLYFNWDEPYNWDIIDASNKVKYISSAFITCKETTINYTNNGTLNAYCIYTGYSPTLHYPYWLNTEYKDLEYDFDISFICTNLYDNLNEYPDQIINRKELLDTIYNNQKKLGYKLAIFGPEKFKDIYPDSYQYFIKYDKTGDMFNRSKINICTHVVGNKQGYLNERIFLIMASGGLLMMDPIPGISDVLINGQNCIFIDRAKILMQIKTILSNYDYYHTFKMKAYKVAQNYTWDDWGMRIQETLLKDYCKK